MGKFIFHAVIALVIVGTIFGFGVVVGGGFAIGAAEAGVESRVADCLPVETADDLEACLAAGEETP